MPERPRRTHVLAIGRSATTLWHTKLRERIHRNLLDLSPLEAGSSGFDACFFFCLGVSSSGMTEKAYRRVTYSVAVTAASYSRGSIPK